MRITFVNVGYGDAILIECDDTSRKSGKFTMLIDGGSNEDTEFNGYPFRTRTVDYLKKEGISHINLLINTHIHEDHMCGLLQVVKHMSIDSMWCNYLMPRAFINKRIDLNVARCESQRKLINAINDYNQLTDILYSRNIAPTVITGIYEKVKLSGGIYADILGPHVLIADELKSRMEDLYNSESISEQKRIVAELDSSMNNTSIMMRLHAGTVKVLLPGDVNFQGYGHVLDRSHLLKADIFKLGHHGQIDSISSAIIQKICPKIILSCASSDRKYESSNPGLFEMIESSIEAYKPVFLFSDNIYLPPYSRAMKDHSALMIDIDETSGEITWTYE